MSKKVSKTSSRKVGVTGKPERERNTIRPPLPGRTAIRRARARLEEARQRDLSGMKKALGEALEVLDRPDVVLAPVFPEAIIQGAFFGVESKCTQPVPVNGSRTCVAVGSIRIVGDDFARAVERCLKQVRTLEQARQLLESAHVYLSTAVK